MDLVDLRLELIYFLLAYLNPEIVEAKTNPEKFIHYSL